MHVARSTKTIQSQPNARKRTIKIEQKRMWPKVELPCMSWFLTIQSLMDERVFKRQMGEHLILIWRPLHLPCQQIVAILHFGAAGHGLEVWKCHALLEEK